MIDEINGQVAQNVLLALAKKSNDFEPFCENLPEDLSTFHAPPDLMIEAVNALYAEPQYAEAVQDAVESEILDAEIKKHSRPQEKFSFPGVEAVMAITAMIFLFRMYLRIKIGKDGFEIEIITKPMDNKLLTDVLDKIKILFTCGKYR